MPIGRRRGGLVRTMGRTAVIAGTATAVSGNVARRQSGRAAAQQQQVQEQQQAAYDAGQADAMAAQQPPPPAPAAAGGDSIEQLERLAKLKEQGILTDEEFSAEKAKILGL
ncbi:MAG TPA: SHOCT domain-containing protein [Acidimicrobiales bacterium]|nr:SHOCT domain-containing protein [Acidimicrobiales bacterium]